MDPLAVRGMIKRDFDVDGRLVGVEVLAASKRLPPARAAGVRARPPSAVIIRLKPPTFMTKLLENKG